LPFRNAPAEFIISVMAYRARIAQREDRPPKSRGPKSSPVTNQSADPTHQLPSGDLEEFALEQKVPGAQLLVAREVPSFANKEPARHILTEILQCGGAS